MILLVRHGETEWNVERRFQGQQDSPLTERGRRQASAMAELVRDLVARETGPWRLVSSPLGRARDTAQAISRATGLAVETDLRLAEVGCGEWEGQLWADVSARHAHVTSVRDWIFRAPGGETYEDMTARLGDFLAEQPPEPDRRLILVSHGAAGRILRGVYAGLSMAEVLTLDIPQDAVHRLANGQIDRFDCEPVD